MSDNVDQDRIEKAVREILEAIGEDPDREGLVHTPQRVAAMYAEIFGGLHEDPAKHLTITFEADHDEMVMVRDIPIHGVCEHHLVPFAGRAHVAYIPGPRGVKKPGALTVTSAVRGLFKTNVATRAEAMSLITHPGNRL